MSCSPRNLAEAWKLQQSIPRSSSFSEGLNKVLSEKLTKSYSVGDNLDRLTTISHLLSSLDAFNSRYFYESFPDLEILKTPDPTSESQSISPVRTVDPNFDINTFLNKLQFLDSRSLSPDLPLLPYTVAQPSLEVSDYISSAGLSEAEIENPVDSEDTEGSSQSNTQSSSGSNTPTEGQEEIEILEEEPGDNLQENNNLNINMANQRQIEAGFSRNPIDTTALRRYAFPGNWLSSQMITRLIDIPYFNVVENDTIVTRGIVLNMYAKGRCSLERWSATVSQRTIAALEAIAPNLPLECFAARDDARLY